MQADHSTAASVVQGAEKQESFDRWIEKELAYYADAKLQDKEVEVLSDLERIQRRNELDRQMLEKMKKAAEENGDQE